MDWDEMLGEKVNDRITLSFVIIPLFIIRDNQQKHKTTTNFAVRGSIILFVLLTELSLNLVATTLV